MKEGGLHLQLLEHAEGVLGRGDVLEGGVDEALQRALELVDVGVELEVVAVELVEREVEQLVRLPLEVDDDRPEVGHEAVHPLEVVPRERRELLDGREHVDELLDAAAEEVELAEDHVLVEVELLALGRLGQLRAHLPVARLVLRVGLEARAQLADQLGRRLLPQVAARLDRLAARGDHLLGDLAEQVLLAARASREERGGGERGHSRLDSWCRASLPCYWVDVGTEPRRARRTVMRCVVE